MIRPINITNKWKALFWFLAFLNIAVLITIFLLLYVPKTSTTLPEDTTVEGEKAEFTLMSTTENINELINSYLTELSKDQPLEYSVSLEDSVELNGTIEAFEKEIPLSMKFQPQVQKNGDLILEQKSITLGRLKLPNRKVLDYIKDNYPMPDWVIVNPDKENIYVAINQINTSYGVQVKASSFDLEKNQLAFKVTVPHETLGIGDTRWLNKFLKQ
ncbi:YpmS family protein [Pontibacillus salicampi]|uniref:YpmS family protein n=1 Tax=Pontibacillus salicampi TaxID=1449801 RepID=A0ABV6LPD3_9BACI